MDRFTILDTLAISKGVIVSFGAHGEQYAHCVGYGRANGLGLRPRKVRIWRASSGKWTKPRKLWLAEIVREPTDDDMKKFKPDFGRAWER